jgi:hypothetical protein
VRAALEAVQHLLARHTGVKVCSDDGMTLFRDDASDRLLVTLRYEHPTYGMLYCTVYYDPKEPRSEFVENLDIAAEVLRQGVDGAYARQSG